MKNKTKCIILGAEVGEKRTLKGIEFNSYLSIDKDGDAKIEGTFIYPEKWQNIEFISRYNEKVDLMFAYDTNRDDGILYLGQWNDGVVIKTEE